MEFSDLRLVMVRMAASMRRSSFSVPMCQSCVVCVCVWSGGYFLFDCGGGRGGSCFNALLDESWECVEVAMVGFVGFAVVGVGGGAMG